MLVGETSSLLTIVKGVKRGGSKIFVPDLESGPTVKYTAVARPDMMASVGAIRLLPLDLPFGFSVATRARGFRSSCVYCTGLEANCR